VVKTHLDRIGSPIIITDASGNVVKEKKYEAFGNLIWEEGSHDDNREFTGKEKDPTGFHYFGARYYYGNIGRFLSPDPHTVIPGNIKLENPQELNPYVYCVNDPLTYVDPNGEIAIVAAVAIGAGMSLATDFATYTWNNRGSYSSESPGSFMKDAITNYPVKRAVISSVAGGASGGIAQVVGTAQGLTLATKVVLNSVTNTAVGVTKDATLGDEITAGSIAAKAGAGGLSMYGGEKLLSGETAQTGVEVIGNVLSNADPMEQGLKKAGNLVGKNIQKNILDKEEDRSYYNPAYGPLNP